MLENNDIKMQTTQKNIRNKIKTGYGQGEGKNYIPWLKVHQVPSKGRSSRVSGWKTGREHHCLSDLETMYLFCLEWSDGISDIREQYPLLPIEETIQIAEELGIKHPLDPDGMKYTVMTTDFLITYKGKSLARTIKYAQDLESLRNIEKFEIERIYWDRRAIDWGIVTERDISRIFADNVRKVHKAFQLEKISREQVGRIKAQLEREILVNNDSLSQLGLQIDERLGFDDGTTLLVAKHFIATKTWQIDMEVPFNPCKPLQVLNLGVQELWGVKNI